MQGLKTYISSRIAGCVGQFAVKRNPAVANGREKRFVTCGESASLSGFPVTCRIVY
jgi:hypothetical protein